MSRQIRDLVERSVHHFAEYFSYYSEGNDFGTEYSDYVFIKRPLLRIKVVGRPGSTCLSFEPALDNMRVLIIKWLHTIIGVNHHLPSVDAIMYPGVQRPKPYLTAVYPDEQYMVGVVERCVAHFHANRPGPASFLAVYRPYHYILDGTAHHDLLGFFALQPPPYLKVFFKLRDLFSTTGLVCRS
nr:dynein heavy chain 3, axonemal-like [Maniola hyperantus]